MDAGPEESLDKIGTAPGPQRNFIKVLQNPAMETALTAVLWNAFPPWFTIQVLFMQIWLSGWDRLVFCIHLKDGSHYPSGHKIAILDMCPVQLMPFRSA